ncbi:UNVERIFIED_CONTAM: Subtilisin-like protease SBT1.9 [Sesamum angustifolium]|uniref:Subtilisin-like protease SBT1.9 n=1 Tax=Sesamum angustifolium TaxID=2727405 RepID=A0AAW2LFM5_9LAMI
MDLSAMPKAFSSHHTWYLTILSSISDSTKPTTTSNFLYAYTNVVNDFSAILSSSELNAIKDSLGYVSSIRDTTVKVDITQSYRFHNDIIVGLLDTGVCH